MLTILYRDDHLVAIDKPAGLLVHRSDVGRRETRFAVQPLRVHDRFGVRRLLLACVGLACRHPVTGTPLVIEAPPGEDFRRTGAALGWAMALGSDGWAGEVAGVALPPADRYA